MDERHQPSVTVPGTDRDGDAVHDEHLESRATRKVRLSSVFLLLQS
jgi:hypothetical protein